MPIPKDIPQERVIINGQKATDLGRTPTVVKPWRDEKLKDLIDPVTLLPRAGKEQMGG